MRFLNIRDNNSDATLTSITHIYGYITKSRRIALELSKSHINDAFSIAGGNSFEYTIKHVRDSDRELRKGLHCHILNTAPRLINGFQRFYKVLYTSIEALIFGHRTTGYFDLRNLDGSEIHASAKRLDLRLFEKAKILFIEKKTFPLGFKKPSILALEVS